MTDYLTCGQCLREFPLHRITGFIQHKKLDCDDIQDASNKDTELQCNYCPQGFMTAWGLLIHAQLTHNLKIFLEKASETFLKQTQLSVHSFLPPCTDKSCLSKNAANMDFNKNSPALETGAILFENESIGKYSPTGKDSSVPAVINTYVPNNISGHMDSSSGVSNGQTFASVSDCITRETDVGLNVNSKGPFVQFDSASTNSNKKTNPVEVVKSTSLRSQFPASIYPIRFANMTIPADAAVDTSRLQSSCSVSLIPAKDVSEKNSSFKRAVATGNQDSSLMLTMANIKLPRMGNLSTADSVNGPSMSTVDLYSPAKTSSLIISSLDSLNSLSLTSVTHSRESFDAIHQSVGDTLQKAGDVQSCLLGNTKDAVISDADMSSAEITELAETCISNMDITGTEKNCCDNQGCGITVIPGSHEDLKECCNAVVPKKRKRHMELKHMPLSRSRLASRRLLYRSIAANSTRSVTSQYLGKSGGTIYIDVEPESLSSSANASTCGGGTALTVTQSTEEDNMLAPGLHQAAQSKQRSLILQPGAVFSIPFTYTIPTSVSVSRPTCINMTNNAITTILDSKSLDSKLDAEDHGDWKITSLLEKTESDLQGSGTGVAMGGVNDNGNLGRHSQSKPFQCEKCTMAFNQRIHLKKHMSKHTGIKPYKCEECNYSTVERSHLKVHIRIHTGEKPFKCTYCEYATAQNSTLKIHLKRHHGGKMFQCHSCDKKFTQERQLRGHEWEHGNKPDSQLD